MKRIVAFVLFAALLLCGCSTNDTVSSTAEQLLRSIAENEEIKIWLEERLLEETATNIKDALIEKFPSLGKLLDMDNLKQILKTTGLDLLREYIGSTEPETQEKANTLGAIIKILSPELSDEVDAVIG